MAPPPMPNTPAKNPESAPTATSSSASSTISRRFRPAITPDLPWRLVATSPIRPFGNRCAQAVGDLVSAVDTLRPSGWGGMQAVHIREGHKNWWGIGVEAGRMEFERLLAKALSGLDGMVRLEVFQQRFQCPWRELERKNQNSIFSRWAKALVYQ